MFVPPEFVLASSDLLPASPEVAFGSLGRMFIVKAGAFSALEVMLGSLGLAIESLEVLPATLGLTIGSLVAQ